MISSKETGHFGADIVQNYTAKNTILGHVNTLLDSGFIHPHLSGSAVLYQPQLYTVAVSMLTLTNVTYIQYWKLTCKCHPQITEA